ncbi:DUF3990 domain-containing protein [Treponema sp.]|uniref:DUF3990 domain-containing protein n=1 Tax=Treponema sp. TaxID=166 RepID=UPI0025E95EBF|nr:DUF3990 domain-containing protein [Treponema sp.]MBR4323530.1 DUF3990 domain-containing protein [Treponema sp.]
MKNLSEGIVLYHGSYCAVEDPDLEKCARFKDFGRGFYLTSSKEQAKSFAKITATKAKSRGYVSAGEKFAYISCFKIESVADLNIFAYETADVNWLHCIVAHRRKDVFVELRKQMESYDVISGKIANDDTNTTIMAYMGNVFGEMGSEQSDKMCISLLLPERLQDQFCFRTDKALSKLHFLKSEKVSLE